MKQFNLNVGHALALFAAAGILAAPVGASLNAYAQISSSDRSQGIEDGLSLIIDSVRARVAQIIDDARSDDTTDEDYNNLVDDVSSNNDIEDDINNSLDDASSIMQDISGEDNTQIASTLTEFSNNEKVVVAEELPDNITTTAVQSAVNAVSTDDVAETLTIEAITDEVLHNNTQLVNEVQDVLDTFVSDALTQRDADVSDLVSNVRGDIEDAVDSAVDENDVSAVISDMTDSDVQDAISNDEISVDAAATQAIVNELESSHFTTSSSSTTATAAQDEIAKLQQQIDDLNARIDQLNSMIQSSNSTSNSTSSANSTSPFT